MRCYVPDDDEPHSVCFSHDGETLRVWIDGEEVPQPPPSP